MRYEIQRKISSAWSRATSQRADSCPRFSGSSRTTLPSRTGAGAMLQSCFCCDISRSPWDAVQFRRSATLPKPTIDAGPLGNRRPWSQKTNCLRNELFLDLRADSCEPLRMLFAKRVFSNILFVFGGVQQGGGFFNCKGPDSIRQHATPRCLVARKPAVPCGV